jgi:indole-3-glycerol phosphate synthase
MNILDTIVAHKQKEIAERKARVPVRVLEGSVLFSTPVISLKEHIQRSDRTGIIAEFKRKSPSRGVINGTARVEEVTQGYVQAGASALSVLTDEHFFGGSDGDLLAARKANACPILRKDFVLDEYQIIEARSLGADVVLLIAAILDPQRIKHLVQCAHRLGLEVLLEVHDEHELRVNVEAGMDLMGINNRNLKTFTLSVDTSRSLVNLIPPSVLRVSESGIESPDTILELRQLGFDGFLIGQTFMQSADPAAAAMEFMNQVRQRTKP